MLSLRFYLRLSAFINPSASLMYQHSRPKDWDLMPEGAETAEEKNLSERKRSLTELFDALSLRPRYKKATDDLNSALAFTKEKKSKASSSSVKGKQKAVEVIGEGEDAEEVELEGEELTGQELNAIYKKCGDVLRCFPLFFRMTYDVSCVGRNYMIARCPRWIHRLPLPWSYDLINAKHCGMMQSRRVYRREI